MDITTDNGDGKGKITVNAQTTSIDIGVAIGAGKSGKFGFDGMITSSFYDSYTLAKIDDAVKVTANSVHIKADDAAYRVGIAGGFASSSSVGIGISGTSSVMLRDAHAVWGNLLNADGSLATIKGDYQRDEEGKLVRDENGDPIKIRETFAGSVVESEVENVIIGSNLHGLNLIVSVAGAATVDSPLDRAKDAQRQEYLNDPNVQKMRKVNVKNENKYQEVLRQQEQAKGDFGLSGALAISYINENSSAGISGNVNINARKIDVEALNSILDVTIGGAAVVQVSVGSNTGIGGGLAVNVLDGSTIAYIQPKTNTVANQITYESLNVNAKRTGSIISIAAGAAGSTSDKGTEVGGSITFNFLDDDTFVRIQNAYLQKKDNTVGNITATASDAAGIYSLAGGLAIGGNVSVGASVAYNYLGLNTHANISNSVFYAKDLTLQSHNTSSILTIAFGGAGGSNAVGGTTAVVISNSTTAAGISESTLTLSGGLIVDATSQAGLGAKSYYNDILGEMDGSKYQDGEYSTSEYTNRDIKLDTEQYDEDGEKIEIITEREYNLLAQKEKQTKLTAEESQKKKEYEQAHANLGLATQSPRIVTAALAVAGGKSTAVGANVAVNILTDTTSTTVSNSSITSTGNATYGATTEGGIFALGIGVAGSTGSAAVSGNVGVNLIGGSTAVYLGAYKDTKGDLIYDTGNNNTLKSENGTFTVQARNASGIIGIGVNVAASGGGAAVGASVGYNQISHETQVLVNKIDISGSAVNLKALNESALTSALLSVGASGNVGVGVSLAINTIGKLGGNTKADFSDAKQKYTDKDGNEQEKEIAQSSTSEIGYEQKYKDENGKEQTKTGTTGETSIRDDLGKQFGEDSTATGTIKALANSDNITQVYITGDSSIESKNGEITFEAKNKGDILAIAAAVGAGGTAGVGAGLVYNNIGGASGIITEDAKINSVAGVTAQSDSTNRIIAVSIGAGGGGTVGIGAGVAVNNLSATNVVSFIDTTTTATNAIFLYARNKGPDSECREYNQIGAD